MKRHTLKSSIAKLLVAFIAVLSVTFIAPEVANAAAAPALNKTTGTILVGKKYDFNIKNKVAKSTYTWSTSKKSVAKVDKKGVVTGVKSGTAYISVKVKTPKKAYTLKAKVTIIKGAKTIQINNKVTALNVGQTYDLNRTLAPSTSNDKTTWKSSNTSIAKPDKNGKFKALKVGTVTITATTLSGAKDTITINVVDADGTVATQSELNSLLGSAVSKITIKTVSGAAFTIAKGDYSKQSLVVDAPNADITNYGKFKSIEIKSIKSDTWTEGAEGNSIIVLDSDARIVIAPGASVSIEATAEGAKLKVVNNGIVKELKLDKKAEIEISGTSTQVIPITVDVPGIKITSSVPLDLTCEVKADLVLLPGAEKSKVTATTEAAIPNISGDVTIDVKVGTGDSAVIKTVKGTPIPSTTPGGSSSPSTPITTVTFFDTIINDITSISYDSYGIPSIVLTTVKNLLKSDNAEYDWSSSLINGTYTVGDQTVTIAPIAGQTNKKTVSVAGGAFSGKSYTVTVTTDNIQTKITIADSVKSVSFIKKPGENNFSIDTAYTIASIKNSATAQQVFNLLDNISVTYKGTAYTVNVTDYNAIIGYINNSVQEVANWTAITSSTPKTYFGQSFTVAQKAGADTSTKLVTFNTSGKVYTVRITGSTSVADITITNGAGVTATIQKGSDTIGIRLP